MPTSVHGRRRRSLPPLGAAARVLPCLAAAWAGWAAAVAHADTWVRPVPGPVLAPFSVAADPFAAGQHRGVDLRARPGRRVVSACGGVVAFAGEVPRLGRVVTVRCGPWRVTYLPLRSVEVRRGEVAARRAVLGAVGAGHGGLHVGVRRAGRRFGYVDPERFFGAGGQPPPVDAAPRPAPRVPLPRVPVPRTGPRPAPRLAPRPVAVPGPAADRSAPGPGVVRPGAAPAAARSRGAAPWPVWLGLALLCCGGLAGRSVGRARRRRARLGRAVRA